MYFALWKRLKRKEHGKTNRNKQLIKTILTVSEIMLTIVFNKMMTGYCQGREVGARWSRLCGEDV